MDGGDKRESTSDALTAKFCELLAENARLEREIAEIRARGITGDQQPLMDALHEYNDMKDLTQVVLGFLANVESVALKELYERYELPSD